MDIRKSLKTLEFQKSEKPYLNDCQQIKLDKDDCITAVTVFEKEQFIHGLSYTTLKGQVSSIDFFDSYTERLPYIPTFEDEKWFAKSYFFNGQKIMFDQDEDLL